MNGLQLSREYYANTAEPSLKREFPDIYPRLAAGLAGNGSECFGYDDEISRDHDWGIDFYIWSLEQDKDRIPSLTDWKRDLFDKHPPQHARERSDYGARIAVMSCGEFYSSLIGAPNGPTTINEYLRAPEENFAMATNGAVFYDGPGEFSKTRSLLLEYFPEDIRRKRIAAKCMALAQTGQYNHSRVARRRDWVTLRTVLSRFTDSAIAMAFLLNRAYRPYYKWAYKALEALPILGAETGRLLLLIAEAGAFDDVAFGARECYIEELCALFAEELRAQGLSSSRESFLVAHGEEAMSLIEDKLLRSLPAQYEI
ncbi:MAG: DUF4037 domain-containing protein [Oscillospiraceae bacterium]|nr:DUF4037 domain-containing protein [Oscillospiraceae bacterium]